MTGSIALDFRPFAKGGRFAGEPVMVELQGGGFIGAQLDPDGSVMLLQALAPQDVEALEAAKKQVRAAAAELRASVGPLPGARAAAEERKAQFRWPDWVLDRTTDMLTEEEVDKALELGVIGKRFGPPLPCIVTKEVMIEGGLVGFVYEGLGGRMFALYTAPENVRCITRLHRSQIE